MANELTTTMTQQLDGLCEEIRSALCEDFEFTSVEQIQKAKNYLIATLTNFNVDYIADCGLFDGADY